MSKLIERRKNVSIRQNILAKLMKKIQIAKKDTKQKKQSILKMQRKKNNIYKFIYTLIINALNAIIPKRKMHMN